MTMKKYSHHTLRGFTLTELLITVVIIGIAMSIGLPSFQEMISNGRLVSAVNTTTGALQLTRSEAIKRVQPVELKIDLKDGNAAQTLTIENVQKFSLPNNISVTASDGLELIYRPDGRINGIAGYLLLTDTPANTAAFQNCRLISITNTGRPSCCKWSATHANWVRCDDVSKACDVQPTCP